MPLNAECAGAFILTLCALLTSQYKSIAATFPVPVLIATLPSERVIPPVDPLPPAVILFAVELPRPVTESRVSVFIAERSGGVYVKAPETLLYVKEPPPEAERLFAEISVREIPPPLPPPDKSGPAIHLEVLPSHFKHDHQL